MKKYRILYALKTDEYKTKAEKLSIILVYQPIPLPFLFGVWIKLLLFSDLHRTHIVNKSACLIIFYVKAGKIKESNLFNFSLIVTQGDYSVIAKVALP